MSDEINVHIFAYTICAFISLIFVIITVSDYGRKHLQLPWYRLLLVSICLYIICITVLIVGVRKIMYLSSL